MNILFIDLTAYLLMLLPYKHNRLIFALDYEMLYFTVSSLFIFYRLIIHYYSRRINLYRICQRLENVHKK